MEKILRNIRERAKQIEREVVLMELCGTHSQTVARYNIKSFLPDNIKLISGPGCPVCVTDQRDVDAMVALAMESVPIAVYGDALALPGSEMSLQDARERGAEVHVVYDVKQALRLKAKSSKLKATPLVFFAIGFETTTPMTAWAVKQGLTVYSSHKLFPPAMTALLANPKLKIDGFINPGHVSAIIGTKPYEQFNIPQVIAGFEAGDVLQAIDLLLGMIICRRTNDCLLTNQYTRLVKPAGNPTALKLIREVFMIENGYWRGLGKIPKSGLELKSKYNKQNAKIVYKSLMPYALSLKSKKSACVCGSILQGLKSPRDCQLFAKKCTPDTPEGACMVSVEGSCNVEYRHGQEA